MSSFANSYFKYVNHLEQINDAALSAPERMIEEVEEAYHNNLFNIARQVVRRGKCRILMLSGPSSSGKTTTAHMLQRELAELGEDSVIVSMDDFYLGANQAPILPDGTYDYEAVEALNVPLAKQCLSDLLLTGRCDMPVFDFHNRKPADYTRPLELKDNAVAIIEGIHALNPVFTQHLPRERVMKLYTSVKQGIKDANGTVISPMDLRLVRRLVRDYYFRNTSLERTFSMWPNVVAGENKYIRPYRHTSDVTVNSIHIYEPCVLRNQAIPLLRSIAPDSPWFQRARELEARLMRFEPIDSDLVPEDSMLREFIGQKQPVEGKTGKVS